MRSPPFPVRSSANLGVDGALNSWKKALQSSTLFILTRSSKSSVSFRIYQLIFCNHIDAKSRLRRCQLVQTSRRLQECRLRSQLHFPELLSRISRESPIYTYCSLSAPRPPTQTCEFKINVPIIFYLLSWLFPQKFVVVRRNQHAISKALENVIDVEEIPTKYKKNGS